MLFSAVNISASSTLAVASVLVCHKRFEECLRTSFVIEDFFAFFNISTNWASYCRHMIIVFAFCLVKKSNQTNVTFSHKNSLRYIYQYMAWPEGLG